MSRPAFPGSGVVCFQPGRGPAADPVAREEGRASYMVMRWTPAGEFLGHVHFIRADLYAGQPAPGGRWGVRALPHRLLRVHPQPRTDGEESDGGGRVDRRRTIAIAGSAVSAAVHAAVRAEVVVAGEGHPLDVRQIRIVDGLRQASYRLPRSAFGTTAVSALPTVSSSPLVRRAGNGGRRDAGCVSCAAVVIDAGQSRAVAVRLRLPADAESGVYRSFSAFVPAGRRARV